MQSQSKSLQELRLESKALYQKALHYIRKLCSDMSLLPITVKSSVATPSIQDYAFADGEYLLETKKWD